MCLNMSSLEYACVSLFLSIALSPGGFRLFIDLLVSLNPQLLIPGLVVDDVSKATSSGAVDPLTGNYLVMYGTSRSCEAAVPPQTTKPGTSCRCDEQ